MSKTGKSVLTTPPSSDGGTRPSAPFTVYDVRVRDELRIKDCAGRKNEIERYFEEFLPKVAALTDAETLRDKDRYLWGKSAYESLQEFLSAQ